MGNWNPINQGVSVSMLNLWLQDKFACKTSYLDGWEMVESWNHALNYGNLVQAGIEGWVKTQQKKGLLRFIQTEYKKQVNQYGDCDDMRWWTSLACHQTQLFVDHYTNDRHLPLSSVHTSERNVRVSIELPSKRKVTLNCYLDGEGDNLIMENKVRGKYDPESIAGEIKWDLQYNFYLLAVYNEKGELPRKVWYQHSRRPGSWGYKGPRKKKSETDSEYLERVKEHMTENPDYYFYRYIGRPTLTDLKRFCHACLYPMLEAFIDWYDYCTKTTNDVNRVDWMTPYGLYNPFVEGTSERFRNYRMTGLPTGLKKKAR